MSKVNSTVLGTYEGKCCDSTVMNNNEMKLGRKLFENLFASEEYKRAIKNRYYIGFLGHPEDPGCMDFKDACIVMTDSWIDQNGEVFGKFDLIDTPVGRIVKAFIDAGVVFGISIRGAGDVGVDGEVDPDTFVFRGYDLVTFPAYDDAVPTFTEIAASSDLEKQVKYKKVCSTIKKNLSAITSCEAIDTIQAQFNPESKEYKELEDRKCELCQEDEVVDVDDQRLEGMTQLYLEQIECNRKLQEQLTAVQVELKQTKVACARKLKVMERVTSSQMSSLSTRLKKTTSREKTLVAANSRLKSELESTKSENLKYTRKIEANTKAVSSKDSVISKLKKDLSETVASNQSIERRASNLDESNKDLKNRIVLAEEMILSYQKAYANMYANALGVRVENLSVCASTSVDELRSMINSGTSTANITPATSVSEPIELMDVEDEDAEDIVTM